jgi:hypothetical protein
VIPADGPGGQRLVLARRVGGKLHLEHHDRVRFVPLVGG